ncbi:hypothetical protein HY030_04325 [Candidatus Gottesmanbacteria bacterium]|nr:hypothetical protein [Candidatus Gottesmanbacteria bacterium]
MVHAINKGKLVEAKDALKELLEKAGGAVSIVREVFTEESRRIDRIRQPLERPRNYGSNSEKR